MTAARGVGTVRLARILSVFGTADFETNRRVPTQFTTSRRLKLHGRYIPTWLSVRRKHDLFDRHDSAQATRRPKGTNTQIRDSRVQPFATRNLQNASNPQRDALCAVGRRHVRFGAAFPESR